MHIFLNLHWEQYAYLISLAATAAFAITAVLAIRSNYDIDIVGAVILGLITAIGGGTVRDMMLGVPVFWSQDTTFLWVAMFSSIAALYGRKVFSHRYMYAVMLYLDALGVALFGIQATAKAWALGFGLPVAPVMMGVTTAIGGGLMRDTLAGRTTLLMRQEIYVSPLLLFSIVYVCILKYFPDYIISGGFICIFGAFALRCAAIYWDLSMPAFARINANHHHL